jgi:hypothetical protein
LYDSDTHFEQESLESDIIVPPLSDPTEACLLLAAASTDRQVQLMQKNLALQIIHHNTVTLQYNHLVLEKAREELHAAEHLIGHVHFTIRMSGIPVAFEGTMPEDHSIQLPSPICSE